VELSDTILKEGFLSAQNRRPIYEISITSGFYLTLSFTSEDKYAMNEG
jgi:hypothetical protein